MRLFLCGDVMIGRGIDQILPRASSPELHEPALTDAREYVRIAERANGAIPRGNDYEYIWGSALDELASAVPAFRRIGRLPSTPRE